MAIPGVKNGTREVERAAKHARTGPRLRTWLRALHRDAGYLAVGLTVVYALSGLAVNHIAQWDPNFRNYETMHSLPAATARAGSDGELAASVLAALGIAEVPRDIYRAAPDRLDITLERRSLHIDLSAGRVIEEGQRPRFLLRAANWLHLNRGKKAWSYIADGYAVFLLFLAVSGMFMLPGRRGILGRGAILIALGAAVPILYVSLSHGLK
jgi:hypothetical protein